MQKQHLSIQAFSSTAVSSRQTATIEQKLGQLQAQLRAMPLPGSADYRFSLSTTRHFAQDVVVELVSWLKETETLVAGKGRRS